MGGEEMMTRGGERRACLVHLPLQDMPVTDVTVITE